MALKVNLSYIVPGQPVLNNKALSRQEKVLDVRYPIVFCHPLLIVKPS